MEKSDQSTSAEAVKDPSAIHLSLHVKSRWIPIFFQLLGHGFSVNVQTGGSVKDLLCKQLGIHKDYLAQRIQTIFLNAKVVDDVNTAIVDEGSTLALSGAMPGLVGAILRSGGFFASMRSQISYKKKQSSPSQNTGKITLKLLNLVVKELGPGFLQRGILLKGKTLQEFVERRAEELMSGYILGEFDGKPLEAKNLQRIDWNADQVLLQVSSEQVE